MRVFESDVLCIGAGLAGERVAVEAAQAGFSVTCLSLVPPKRSHSSAAMESVRGILPEFLRKKMQGCGCSCSK